MRILLLIAIGLMLYIIIARLLKRKVSGDKSAAVDAMDELVTCQYCGIHILQKEAVQRETDGAYYCCSEHESLD